MVTAVVSDLHLGARGSVLGTRAALEPLLRELERVDQVVLLGDVLALRDATSGEIVDAALPVLDELAGVLAGRRVVVVPGNHDHRLVELAREAAAPTGSDALAAEWRPADGVPGRLGALFRSLSRSETALAYPGVWIRPDVYATHGHYLDCHITVPRLEALLAAGMTPLAGRLPAGAVPDDYEAILAPVYAFLHARAQTRDGRVATPSPVRAAAVHVRAYGWSRVQGDRAPGRVLGRMLARAGATAGLAVLGRVAGRRFTTELAPEAICRAGVAAMAEVVSRLRIRAEHVVFGHTHRAGPLVGEAPWLARDGTRLHNAGSWVYEPALIGPRGQRDPYWPGTVAVVRESGAPEVRALLVESAPPA